MVIGEICNFSAYAFAPAILVTPLGALSVLIGAVLGSYFLGERLGILGRVGCAICLIGSVIIVLHAPPDKELKNVGELLHFAMMPGEYMRDFGREKYWRTPNEDKSLTSVLQDSCFTVSL